jgi:hypothetical protein
VNQETYDKVRGELLAEAESIQTAKRPGYTLGNADVLRNFKATAAEWGITPAQAWGVFFQKHLDAIKSIMTKPDLPVSEAPLGRFADAINYLQLGWGLLQERDGTLQQVPEKSLYEAMVELQAKLQAQRDKFTVRPEESVEGSVFGKLHQGTSTITTVPVPITGLGEFVGGAQPVVGAQSAARLNDFLGLAPEPAVFSYKEMIEQLNREVEEERQKQLNREMYEAGKELEPSKKDYAAAVCAESGLSYEAVIAPPGPIAQPTMGREFSHTNNCFCRECFGEKTF